MITSPTITTTLIAPEPRLVPSAPPRRSRHCAGEWVCLSGRRIRTEEPEFALDDFHIETSQRGAAHLLQLQADLFQCGWVSK